ncbi:hypothetical protein TetV_155 [Tetraselmis virus 1]|uniref:Uncharacterized protein n=1 Tax=Tetraselmis virus 1 TaxID=2060617 RepID=A0A2P0VMV9_9VIRU|nr:hypothetical protein QJ968_gp155 [Tetraselmis virus 1]AUF82247.1 hypothetical protein TetV_155 [Tetraselmis virus 1]
MSFSRLDYDPGAYRQSLRESMGVGAYMIDTPLPYSKARVGASQTDVESELQGLPRPLTEVPSKKFIPGRYDTSHIPPLPDNIHLRRDLLYPEETRISNPPSTLRGTGINRFGHPLEAPQDHALEPFEWPTSDARNAKDNHRPCITDPIDIKQSLPPPVPEHVPQPNYVFDPVPNIPHIVVAQPPKEFRYIL